MAFELRVSLAAFKLWEKAHPEFMATVKEAVDLAQGWWERQGRKATFRSEGFNATSYIFNMTNRIGADWKHKAEQINVHIEAGDSLPRCSARSPRTCSQERQRMTRGSHDIHRGKALPAAATSARIKRDGKGRLRHSLPARKQWQPQGRPKGSREPTWRGLPRPICWKPRNFHGTGSAGRNGEDSPASSARSSPAVA